MRRIIPANLARLPGPRSRRCRGRSITCSPPTGTAPRGGSRRATRSPAAGLAASRHDLGNDFPHTGSRPSTRPNSSHHATASAPGATAAITVSRSRPPEALLMGRPLPLDACRSVNAIATSRRSKGGPRRALGRRCARRLFDGRDDRFREEVVGKLNGRSAMWETDAPDRSLLAVSSHFEGEFGPI